MTSMTLDPPLTNPLPPGSELVAGVDTHKNTHHVAILDLVGRPVADREFRADGRGYAQIVAFLHAHGDVVRIGVEGTGSYGAGLARALTTAGLTVIEVARQDRQARRRRGKSDPLDAHQAAVAVLAGTDTAIPKSGDGAVESMRIPLAERRSAAKARAQVMNQIHALLITAPELVRQAFRALSGQRLVNTLAKTRPGTITSADPAVVARQTLRRFAVRHLTMQAEIDLIEQQLEMLVRQVNPTLLSLSGVGPVTAATLLVAAGDNPERLGSDADDIAAVLHYRVERATARPAGSGRTRKPARLIAGLIPSAHGVIDVEMRAALDEREELIEARADAVLEAALTESTPWTNALGVAPTDRRRAATWRKAARVVAAYRDRHRVTDEAALGAPPESAAQKIDAARARAALRQATDIATAPSGTRPQVRAELQSRRL
ncbi:IS110 family transposase [Tessaracoccus flavescens]|uniref:IS110 family transposase n=1 Tax=Tessaracoccus flavescens TaxID=399497 RepID=UPI000985B2D3|nr:transposase [Tessaracoccus flavescens]